MDEKKIIKTLRSIFKVLRSLHKFAKHSPSAIGHRSSSKMKISQKYAPDKKVFESLAKYLGRQKSHLKTKPVPSNTDENDSPWQLYCSYHTWD